MTRDRSGERARPGAVDRHELQPDRLREPAAGDDVGLVLVPGDQRGDREEQLVDHTRREERAVHGRAALGEQRARRAPAGRRASPSALGPRGGRPPPGPARRAARPPRCSSTRSPAARAPGTAPRPTGRRSAATGSPPAGPRPARPPPAARAAPPASPAGRTPRRATCRCRSAPRRRSRSSSSSSRSASPPSVALRPSRARAVHRADHAHEHERPVGRRAVPGLTEPDIPVCGRRPARRPASSRRRWSGRRSGSRAS